MYNRVLVDVTAGALGVNSSLFFCFFEAVDPGGDGDITFCSSLLSATLQISWSLSLRNGLRNFLS